MNAPQIEITIIETERLRDWVPFWMIFVAGTRAPRKKYKSFELAKFHSRQLALATKKTVFILSCTHAIPNASFGIDKKKVLDKEPINAYDSADTKVPALGETEAIRKIPKARRKA